MNLTADVLMKLRTLKGVVRQMSNKSLLSEDPTTRNKESGPKHCRSLHKSTFIIIPSQYLRN